MAQFERFTSLTPPSMDIQQAWIISMPNNQTYVCPVCGYDSLTEPPYDAYGCALFEICPSCETQFGYQDAGRSHEDLRESWLRAGAPWHSKVIAPPSEWNAIRQLKATGFD